MAKTCFFGKDIWDFKLTCLPACSEALRRQEKLAGHGHVVELLWPHEELLWPHEASLEAGVRPVAARSFIEKGREGQDPTAVAVLLELAQNSEESPLIRCPSRSQARRSASRWSVVRLVAFAFNRPAICFSPRIYRMTSVRLFESRSWTP